jgi:extracellular factor (EF) 3-hydroxypalmitic acid methyl ester biosynthesis protein
MMNDLVAVVEAATNGLVADLRRAEGWTRGWTDQKLADMAVQTALSSCLARLAKTGCWGEANRLPSSQLWRIAGLWLKRGVMQTHARTKPLGYAGDHQMLSRIWDHWCCDDPLGGAFDRYFQRQVAPEAVRARFHEVAAEMAVHCLSRSQPVYEVVSVGSGPAIDLSEGLASLPADRRELVRVELLDLDPQALDSAKGRLAPLLPPAAISAVRTNLYRLSQRTSAADRFKPADLLVCPGLFDYLADPPAIAMLDLFWRRLKPGGMMLVGNFAPHNPTRAYMEWIGNWYLLYRTPERFAELAAQAGIPDGQFTVCADRTGIDLFLRATRP